MKRYKIDMESTLIYFCTCTIVEWQFVFKEEKYFKIIIDSLGYCQQHKGLLLYGYVIMPNHLHLLVGTKENFHLSNIMRDFKRHTSKQIHGLLENDNEKIMLHLFRNSFEKRNDEFKIWKDDFHPVAILSDEWFYQKLNYIHDNPIRKGFVIKQENWKYSSAANWILEDHSIIKLDLEYLGY
ncbi:MAG TPA: transposase [bacterium]|nr:transposase [bacterium]HPN45958.1 transposase [bacterium]